MTVFKGKLTGRFLISIRRRLTGTPGFLETFSKIK